MTVIYIQRLEAQRKFITALEVIIVFFYLSITIFIILLLVLGIFLLSLVTTLCRLIII